MNTCTKNRRFHHENGGFPNFMRRKQYGSNLLTHTVTHTPIAYSGQGSTKEKLVATKSEITEKLLKISMQNYQPSNCANPIVLP